MGIKIGLPIYSGEMWWNQQLGSCCAMTNGFLRISPYLNGVNGPELKQAQSMDQSFSTNMANTPKTAKTKLFLLNGLIRLSFLKVESSGTR